MRILNYNILNGGGLDKRHEKASAEIGFPGNRLEKIEAVIRWIEPDIICLQEANLWQRSRSKVLRQFESIFGMKGFLSKAKTGHHVGILSRYEIIKVQTFQRDRIFSRAALRATVRIANDRNLTLFIVHLHPNPQDREIKDREIRFLLSRMEKFKDTQSLLIGDMNWPDPDIYWHRWIADAGWHYLTRSFGGRWEVDELWAAPALSADIRILDPVRDCGVSKDLLDQTSDHYPIVFEVPLIPSSV